MLKITAMIQSPDMINEVKKKQIEPLHFSGSSARTKLEKEDNKLIFPEMPPRACFSASLSYMLLAMTPEKTKEPAGFASVRKLYKAPNFFKPKSSEAAAGTMAQWAP